MHKKQNLVKKKKKKKKGNFRTFSITRVLKNHVTATNIVFIASNIIITENLDNFVTFTFLMNYVFFLTGEGSVHIIKVQSVIFSVLTSI